MAKINLTDEERNQIIEALQYGTEPDPELMPKLFPNPIIHMKHHIYL